MNQGVLNNNQNKQEGEVMNWIYRKLDFLEFCIAVVVDNVWTFLSNKCRKFKK